MILEETSNQAAIAGNQNAIFLAIRKEKSRVADRCATFWAARMLTVPRVHFFWRFECRCAQRISVLSTKKEEKNECTAYLCSGKEGSFPFSFDISIVLLSIISGPNDASPTRPPWQPVPRMGSASAWQSDELPRDVVMSRHFQDFRMANISVL
jgi:hypothetical protein